jgi:Phosphotransferase enzyme family
MASTFDPVPASLESVLDPVWLAWALEDVAAEERIVEVTTVDSFETVASKILIRVVVEGPDGSRRPRTYCIKGHFDDSIGNSLGSETRFYRELRPRVGVRTPQAYYTGADAETGRSLIIMDDVVALGGRFLSAHSPYSPGTVRDTLGQLAQLHAATWGQDKLKGLDWLEAGIRDRWERYPTAFLQEQLRDGRGPGLPPELLDAECVKEALFRTDDAPVTCVLHGDTHSGNAYLDREGRACWLDWQVIHIGNWATDVSYHIATSLDVEDRRTYESELLRYYLDQLAGLGVEPPGWDEAWDLYTLQFPYGYFLWAITRISSRAVVLVHIPRLGAAITDHQSFHRLGVA